MSNQEKIKSKIHDLIDEAYNVYSEDSIDDCIKLLNQAWEILPEKKESWDEGFKVVKEIVETYFYSGNIKLAEKWMASYIECDAAQRNYGDSELMGGKIAFARDDMEQAEEYFKISDKKSGGRIWEGEDIKYFQLLNKK